MVDGLPGHFCPGCGVPLKPFARYPWYFCNNCRDTTTDGNGRAIGFYERTLHGGLAWYYCDDKARMHANLISVRCLIAGRPVLVAAARFGGIVAEPDTERHTGYQFGGPGRYPDLTTKYGIEAAIQLMTESE